MTPDKQIHALRRQRMRRAARRRKRLEIIKQRSREHIIAASRWTVRKLRPQEVVERTDGSRLPTRQELQVEAEFHHAVRELGLA